MNVSAHTDTTKKIKTARQAPGKCMLNVPSCKKKLFSKQGVDLHIFGHKRHLCKLEHLKDQNERQLFETTAAPNITGLIEAAEPDNEKTKACKGPKCREKCSTSLYVTGGTKLIEGAEKLIYFYCSLKCLVHHLMYIKISQWRAYTNSLDVEFQAKQAAKSTLSDDEDVNHN